jgi:beta-phosphoglucomutase
MNGRNAVDRLVDTAAAVIFDFDGVIVDSEPLKAAAYADTFREVFGRALDPADFGWRGLREAEVIAYWCRALGFSCPADPGALIARKRERYRELLASDRLRPIPGAATFLRKLAARGTTAALATTSTRSDQRAICERLGLAKLFRVVTTLDDISRPKPDPEVYLTTLARLGLPGEKCLAFEDTPAGAAAARGAGIPVVAVLTSYPAAAFPEAAGSIPDFIGLDGAQAAGAAQAME